MRPQLSAAELDARRFPQATLDALFAAVLENDVADARLDPPAAAPLDFSRARLVDGFRLSRQLWRDGVDRVALRTLADKLLRTGDLDLGDRAAFKQARARFKHLRFAFVLYDEAHRCPPLLKAATTSLGHLQDAFRTGRRGAARRHASALRLVATPTAYALLARETDRLRPTSEAGHRRFAVGEMVRLRAMLAEHTLSAATFHAARKVVSRQVSFYDDMRVLDPSPDLRAMSRVLAAANGEMGAFHDRLVEGRGAPATFPWPSAMRAQLVALADLYPPDERAAARDGGASGDHDIAGS